MCTMEKLSQRDKQYSLQNGRRVGRVVAACPSRPRSRISRVKPNPNKRMLINDWISAPHHTADDKFGDGRLGGTTCGFPLLFGAVGGRRGIKAELGCYQGPAEDLSEIKEEVVKVGKGNGVPPWNPPHTHSLLRLMGYL